MDNSTRFQFGWQEKQIGALSLRNIAFAGEGGGLSHVTQKEIH